MGPRLMAFFGNDRTIFQGVEEALQHSEIAPILIQSGKTKMVKQRYMCSKFRQQTFVEFADGSRKKIFVGSGVLQAQKSSREKSLHYLESLGF